MITAIITPAWPPDPSEAARYTKLLATHLQPEYVIAFGYLPESVAGVSIVPISKQTSRITRLTNALKKLHQTKPDVLVIQNGPSAELPSLVYLLTKKTKAVYVISDHAAAETNKGWFKNWLHKQIKRRAITTVVIPKDSAVYMSPEWLPEAEPNNGALQAYKNWWEEHLTSFKV